MAIIAAELMTAEQFSTFVARPENVDRWFELERRAAIELPPPKKPNGIVCGNITRFLSNEYLDSGVREVWVVDPAARDVAIHSAAAALLLLSEKDELDGEPTLPGFHCQVAEFFHALPAIV